MEPFQLMDLPREVRDNIYKAVLDPIRNDPKFDGTTLSVTSSGRKPHWPADYPGTPNGPEDAEQRRLRHSFRPTHYTDREKHPGRISDYVICPAFQTDCYIDNSKETVDICSLSNTNSIIRTELAEAIWARSKISLDAAPIEEFEAFLADRPAIWGGIKELRITWDLVYPTSPIPESFVKACERISNRVHFEKLEVEFTINEEEIIRFFRINEKPTWARGIQKLAVTGGFKFELVACPDMTGTDEEWEKEGIDLKKEYEQLMEGVMRPDSLTPKEKPLEEMTDVERYMATRL